MDLPSTLFNLQNMNARYPAFPCFSSRIYGYRGQAAINHASINPITLKEALLDNKPILYRMRRAPSNRITSPFIIPFSMICPTKAANSSGCPKRLGNVMVEIKLS